MFYIVLPFTALSKNHSKRVTNPVIFFVWNSGCSKAGEETKCPLKNTLWSCSVAQHSPKPLMGQGKRRPAEQGPPTFPADEKTLCGNGTQAWFLDECDSSHCSEFISNSFNFIVKRNRYKVCFGAAHHVVPLSNKLPTAHFFKWMYLAVQHKQK